MEINRAAKHEFSPSNSKIHNLAFFSLPFSQIIGYTLRELMKFEVESYDTDGI